ncbi:hypothetical protein Y032_0685g1518 [Ancylostoma ceylanicum]|uniref:Uncharacterized protein n=1 Tax=Ancylostoma ceylanicum TaxID=53326 RepID=A0A016WIU5_9BILA|nr:hypothetical protein Y032_0685g1518 [Ancylostoma ceylanicum]
MHFLEFRLKVAAESHKSGRLKQCGFSWMGNRGAAPSLVALIAVETFCMNNLFSMLFVRSSTSIASEKLHELIQPNVIVHNSLQISFMMDFHFVLVSLSILTTSDRH